MSTTQRHSLRDLYWISLAFLFAFLGPGTLQLFLTDLYELGGVDKATAGLMRSWLLICLYGSFLVWRVFVSAVIGRIGHQWAITIGATTYLAFAMVLGWCHVFAAHVLAAVVIGFGAACLWIASTAHLLHATPSTRYGFATGFRRNAVMVGLVVGYVAVAAFLETGGKTVLGTHPATLLAAGAGLVAVVATLFIPRRHVPVAPFSLGLFRRVAWRPGILLVGFFLLGSAMSYGIVLSFLRDFVKDRGDSSLLVGLTCVAFPLAQGLCSVAGGAAMDWLGKTKVLAVGFTVAAVGLVGALGLTGVSGSGVLWLAVPTLLLGIMNALVGVGADSLAGDLVREEHRQIAIGAMFLWRDLGIIVPIAAQLALGADPSRTPYKTVFAAFAVYFLVCAVAAALASRRLGAGAASSERPT